MQFYWLASLAVSLLVVTSICKSEIATISCVFETRSPSAASNCVVQDITNFPWPDKTENTSPPPASLKADWYRRKLNHDDDFEIIDIKLVWTQEMKHFKNFVHGYVLSASMTDAIGDEKKLINFRNKTEFFNLTDSFLGLFSFKYEEFGRNSKFGVISPGSTYYFKLFSLPMYFESTIAGFQVAILQVPTCDSSYEINATKNCVETRMNPSLRSNGVSLPLIKSAVDSNNTTKKENDKIETRKKLTNDNRTTTILTIVFAVFLLGIVVILLIILRQNCGMKSLPGVMLKKDLEQKKSVLLLVELSNKVGKMPYYEVAGRLGFILKEYGRVTVRCNLWEKSKIIDSRIWLKKNIQSVDHVVLFIDPLSQTFVSELVDSFFPFELHRSGLNNPVLRKVTCSVVSCRKSKIFIKNLDCQKYELTKDFNSLFKNLTGRKVKTNIPSFAKEDFFESVMTLRSSSDSDSIDYCSHGKKTRKKPNPLLQTSDIV